VALLNSEVLRIKAELGFNVLGVGATPYFGVISIFDQIIQTYLTAGATTTSLTTVTAAAPPAPVQILLASATGFSAGDRVVLDVDSRQEPAIVESLSGNLITVLLSIDHGNAGGTLSYPVTVDGGETIVREALRRVLAVKVKMEAAMGLAGLKRAEDVEWYQGTKGGSSLFGDLAGQLNYWRMELAKALGMGEMYRQMQAQTSGSGGQSAVPC
jgi:hypothetical protein